MKRSLGLFVGLLLTHPAFALRGTVLNIDPVEIKTDSSTPLICKIEASKFHLWEGRGILELSGHHDTDCGQQNSEMGELNSPLSLQVEIDNVKKSLTLPAHQTRISWGQSGFLISVQRDWNDSIGIEDPSTVAAREAIRNQHQSHLRLVESKLKLLEEKVAKKDYRTARKVYSEISKTELFSPLIATLHQILSKMPLKEQPIPTHRSETRYYVESLNRAFGGIDFDQLTRTEFFSRVHHWSIEPPRADRAGDESHLLVLLSRITPADLNIEPIILQTLTSRLRALHTRLHPKSNSDLELRNTSALISRELFDSIRKDMKTALGLALSTLSSKNKTQFAQKIDQMACEISHYPDELRKPLTELLLKSTLIKNSNSLHCNRRGFTTPDADSR